MKGGAFACVPEIAVACAMKVVSSSRVQLRALLLALWMFTNSSIHSFTHSAVHPVIRSLFTHLSFTHWLTDSLTHSPTYFHAIHSIYQSTHFLTVSFQHDSSFQEELFLQQMIPLPRLVMYCVLKLSSVGKGSEIITNEKKSRLVNSHQPNVQEPRNISFINYLWHFFWPLKIGLKYFWNIS